MTILTPLKPSGYKLGTSGSIYPYAYTTAWNEGAAEATQTEIWTNLQDDGVGSGPTSGDTAIGLTGGTNAARSIRVHLSDVNVDFITMDTLVCAYSSAQVGPYVDDEGEMVFNVWNSAETNMLAGFAESGDVPQTLDYFSDANGWAETGDGGSATAPAYDKAVTFGFVDTTADKAEWDDAFARINYRDSRNMGADGAAIILVDFELTGTYTAGLPEANRHRMPNGNWNNRVWY